MTHALRVLVVEDEMMIAMLMEDMLQDLGYETVGPARRLESGMKIAGSEQIDLAILDINLGGAQSFPIAALLVARGIPVIFATGYGVSGLSNEYMDFPVIAKPFSVVALRQAIRSGFFLKLWAHAAAPREPACRITRNPEWERKNPAISGRQQAVRRRRGDERPAASVGDLVHAALFWRGLGSWWSLPRLFLFLLSGSAARDKRFGSGEGGSIRDGGGEGLETGCRLDPRRVGKPQAQIVEGDHGRDHRDIRRVARIGRRIGLQRPQSGDDRAAAS